MSAGFSPLRVPTRQPRLNFNHPLAQGLVFCGLPAWGDFVTGTRPQLISSTTTLQTCDTGLGAYVTQAGYGDRGCIFALPPGAALYQSGPNLTWGTVGTVLALGGYCVNLGVNYGNGNAAPYALQAQFANSSYAGVRQVGIPANASVTQAANFYDGSFPSPTAVPTSQTFLNGNSNGTAFQYTNGVASPTTTYSSYAGTVGWGSKEPVSLYNTGYVTGSGFATSESIQGVVTGGFIWNRALSTAEAELWSAEPFSMLQPAGLQSFFFLSGTSTVTNYSPTWWVDML